MLLDRFRDLNMKSVYIAGRVENDATVYPSVQNFALHSDNLVLIFGRMHGDITNSGFHRVRWRRVRCGGLLRLSEQRCGCN